MEILLLGVDVHMVASQLPECLNSIQRIPLKPADGFRQDHIHLTDTTLRQQLLKFHSPLHNAARSLTCIDPSAFPTQIAFNCVGIILKLRFQAHLQLIRWAAHPAVGSHMKRFCPESGYLRVWQGSVPSSYLSSFYCPYSFVQLYYNISNFDRRFLIGHFHAVVLRGRL